jgi:hypothetical protein
MDEWELWRFGRWRGLGGEVALRFEFWRVWRIIGRCGFGLVEIWVGFYYFYFCGEFGVVGNFYG